MNPYFKKGDALGRQDRSLGGEFVENCPFASLPGFSLLVQKIETSVIEHGRVHLIYKLIPDVPSRFNGKPRTFPHRELRAQRRDTVAAGSGSDGGGCNHDVRAGFECKGPIRELSNTPTGENLQMKKGRHGGRPLR